MRTSKGSTPSSCWGQQRNSVHGFWTFTIHQVPFFNFAIIATCCHPKSSEISVPHLSPRCSAQHGPPHLVYVTKTKSLVRQWLVTVGFKRDLNSPRWTQTLVCLCLMSEGNPSATKQTLMGRIPTIQTASGLDSLLSLRKLKMRVLLKKLQMESVCLRRMESSSLECKHHQGSHLRSFTPSSSTVCCLVSSSTFMKAKSPSSRFITSTQHLFCSGVSGLNQFQSWHGTKSQSLRNTEAVKWSQRNWWRLEAKSQARVWFCLLTNHTRLSL